MLSRPQMLIIVRAGHRSIHRSWTWLTAGLADVAISAYDDSDFSADDAHYLHRFTGGKFPGIADFLRANPDVIERYDYFMLFEDDLVLPFASLRRISSLLARFPFDLAAPGLAGESFFTWPLAIANSRFLLRGTDFVEVMMPIMSRAFLRAALPAFDENSSAWGQEWLWRKLLQERGTLAAILDCAPVTHTRPFGSGTLLRNRPPGSPDPKDELEAMLAKYNLDQTVPFRNYFGITRDTPPRLLAHDAMLQEALSGYRDLQALPNDSFMRCVDTLINGSRPIATIEALHNVEAFRMVEAALPETDLAALLDAPIPPRRPAPPIPATHATAAAPSALPAPAITAISGTAPDAWPPPPGITLRDELIRRIWRGQSPWATPPATLTPHFQGWGSSHAYLTDAIDAAGPRCVVVEIGVWKGGSTLTMAQRLYERGIDGVVIAVDTWLGAWDHWILEEWFPELRLQGGMPHLYDVFRSNVIERGLRDYVLPLPLDSVNAAHVLRHFNIAVDVLHIDGGHDFDAVTADLRNWWPLLAPGGVLIGDDYSSGGGPWPEVTRAFDTFFHGRRLENVQGKCRVAKTSEDPATG